MECLIVFVLQAINLWSCRVSHAEVIADNLYHAYDHYQTNSTGHAEEKIALHIFHKLLFTAHVVHDMPCALQLTCGDQHSQNMEKNKQKRTRNSYKLGNKMKVDQVTEDSKLKRQSNHVDQLKSLRNKKRKVVQKKILIASSCESNIITAVERTYLIRKYIF